MTSTSIQALWKVIVMLFLNPGIPEEESVAEFQARIANECGVESGNQQFKIGFPPQNLPITDASIHLSAWGLKSGDSLMLEVNRSGNVGAATTAEAGAMTANGCGWDEDELLARAIAASLDDARPYQALQSAPKAMSISPAVSENPKGLHSVTNAPSGSLVAVGMSDGRYAFTAIPTRQHS
jgi:hypothetical protein